MTDTFSKLEEFFYDNGEHEEQLRNDSPFFVIDFDKLYDLDMDIAFNLVSEPKKFFDNARNYIRPVTLSDGTLVVKEIQVKNLVQTTPIRNIKSEHINKMLQLESMVTTTSIPYSVITKAVFECPKCLNEITVEQDGFDLRVPVKCSCNNKRNFLLLHEKCDYDDMQLIMLQERPEELPAGEIPEPLFCYLKGDLIRSASPGDRATITGLVSTQPTKKKMSFDRIFNANYVETHNKDNSEYEFTEEHVAEFIKISEMNDLDDVLINSYAPHIFGWRHVKQAHLYALTGSPPMVDDNATIRGDIHVLMVGDAGVSKSQLLKFDQLLANRSVFTSGRGASGVGLTASLVKINDRFMLVPGSMALADKGICLIDEGEKMNEVDMEAIHTPLEDQIIRIDKADIHTTLNSRCSVVMACNPNTGKYVQGKPLRENIDFKDTLLSRFDLIFVMIDMKNEDIDDSIADAILGLGEAEKTPPLNIATLKNYIQYSKRFKPTISKKDKLYIKKLFLEKRVDEEATWRHLNSIQRISKARARSHLREEVSTEDIDVAYKLLRISIEEAWTDPFTGEIDINPMIGMTSKSVKKQGEYLPLIVEHLLETDDAVMDATGKKHVSRNALVDMLMENPNIDKIRANEVIDYAKGAGLIYYPSPGKVSVI